VEEFFLLIVLMMVLNPADKMTYMVCFSYGVPVRQMHICITN